MTQRAEASRFGGAWRGRSAPRPCAPAAHTRCLRPAYPPLNFPSCRHPAAAGSLNIIHNASAILQAPAAGRGGSSGAQRRATTRQDTAPPLRERNLQDPPAAATSAADTAAADTAAATAAATPAAATAATAAGAGAGTRSQAGAGWLLNGSAACAPCMVLPPCPCHVAAPTPRELSFARHPPAGPAPLLRLGAGRQGQDW